MEFYDIAEPGKSTISIQGHPLQPSQSGWLVQNDKFVSFWTTWNVDGTISMVLSIGITVRSKTVYTKQEAIGFISNPNLSKLMNSGEIPDGFYQIIVGQ